MLINILELRKFFSKKKSSYIWAKKSPLPVFYKQNKQETNWQYQIKAGPYPSENWNYHMKEMVKRSTRRNVGQWWWVFCSLDGGEGTLSLKIKTIKFNSNVIMKLQQFLKSHIRRVIGIENSIGNK